MKKFILLAGLILGILGDGRLHGGTVIVSDNCNVSGSGSGFSLNSGVNSGINPPTTRLTGVAAPGLRYMNTGTKATSAYTITSNKIKVTSAANPGRFVLSPNGSAPFDFGTALGIATATAENPVVYEIAISMDNDSSGTQRFSFALGTTEGDAGSWDFGIQVYRAASGNNFYTIGKRIDTDASGLGSDLNEAIYTLGSGTYGTEISLLMRVTDAGSESSGYHSRVQLSLNGGSTWFYDTQTDSDLVNGWRLNGAGRIIMWDVAPGAGNVTYDNFSLTWISGLKSWVGSGASGDWSDAANWAAGTPVNGDGLVFNGTTHQDNTNDLSNLSLSWLTFNNGGFTLNGNEFATSSAITNLVGNNTLKANLAWDSSSIKTWHLGSGSELVLDNVTSIETNGDHTLYGGGTVRLKGTLNVGQSTTANPAIVLNEATFVADGGTFNSDGGFRVGANASSQNAQTLLILTNGANFNLTSSGANVRVGNSLNGGTGRMEINNSTVTLAGGSIAIPYTSGATGILEQVGGTVSGGSIVFSDANAGTGTYSIQNGTLEAIQIRDDHPAGSASMYFDNATLRTASGASSAFLTGLDLAQIESGGLTIDTTTDIAIDQTLSGTGALNKTGSASLTLNGNNSFSGGANLNAGTLYVGHNSALGSGSLAINSGTLVASGGARQIANDVAVAGNFAIDGSAALTFSGDVNIGSGNRVLSVASGASSTFSGVLSGTGGFTKSGGGSLQLSGGSANTISGETIVNEGILTLAKSAGINAIAGAVTIGDGAGSDVVRLNAANQISDASEVTILSSGVLDLNGFDEAVASVSGSSASSQILLGAGSLTLGDASSSTFAGTISGSGNFAKQGGGKMTLTGASSFSGTTTVNGGVLNVQGASALGSGGNVIVNSGAALEIQGGVTISGQALTLNGAGVSFGGALRNISSANAWSGSLTLGSVAEIESDSGTLTLSGSIGGSGNNLTIGGTGDVTINGAIATGSGTFTKNDSGTLTLGAANTFSGNTTINGGTLALSAGGSIANSSTITIANGTTFDVSGASGYALGGAQTLARNSTSGTGTINGSITFNSGASLSLLASGTAGSIGGLSVSGDLTLNDNAIDINVSGNTLGAGSYSLVTYTGTLNGTFNLTPTITGSGVASGMKAVILETDGVVALKVVPVETNAVFRVMTYNMHFGSDPVTGNIDTTRAANFILSNNVDLVGLNEVARNMPRSNGRDLIAELSQKTGMAYVFSNNIPTLSGDDEFGNAILSKYPILLRDHRLLPKVGDHEQRGWLKAIVDVKGKYVSFQSTHLDFHNDNTERLMCVTNFNTWLADETVPAIICGDFNDAPNGAFYDVMDQKWDDIWPIAGDGSLGRTAPSPGYPNNLNVRIDYIWKQHGASIKPTNAFVGYTLEASDHYPVITDFILTSYTNHAPGFSFAFDEGTGSTNTTDSIGGLKGTIDGTAPVWKTNSPSGQAGDYSLYFNGSRKLTVQDPKQILGTNGFNDDYTLQAWVKVAVNYTPATRAVMFQYERRPGFSFSINTNRTLHTTTFKIKDISSSATLPNDGNWHHVAVVHTAGANMKFYIDGSLAATVAYTNGCGYRPDSTITMGSEATGANPFTGYLDRVKFVNRALTSAELDYSANAEGDARPATIVNDELQPWKNRYGIVDVDADSDGDGQSNFAEFLAHTIPTNAASALKILEAHSDNGQVTLTWASVGGVRYRIQYADGLNGAYQDLVRDAETETDSNAPGAESMQSFTDTAAPPSTVRFYRVKVLTP